MNKKRLNMSDLEKEMASVETDAVVEEQYNADQNYSALDDELKEAVRQIPFPRTEMYTTGHDYESGDRMQYEKACNKPFWDKRDDVARYCNNDSLYKGHLSINGADYYFMESSLLETKNIRNSRVWLINVDDRKYGEYVKLWRYPSENDSVQFSRNIIMRTRKVSDVDIVLDKSNELFSNIPDAYLRKALIRNKFQNTAQSIIQTIQKKQDTIRSLPKEKSFIVQGCAGSGKTMVLLHRLRYLLHNKDIYNDDYVFLVPSNGFKEFISEISANFNIGKNNILPYQEYYQTVLGKSPNNTNNDTSELVFEPEYLETVYSKKFMQEAYKTLFDAFFKQTESLIVFCEDKFNGLLEHERAQLEDTIKNAKADAINNANDVAKEIQKFTTTKIDYDFANIQSLITEIEETYTKRKREYEIASNPNLDISISPDDARILSNAKLIEIKKSIDAEKLAIEKASIFTVLSHRNKLKKLQENYDMAYEALVSHLKEEDKSKYAKQAAQLLFVYDNISISATESVLETLKSILTTATDVIDNAQTSLDNIDEYIGEKFSTEITNINKLIEVSGDVVNVAEKYIETLLPAYEFFEKNITLGVELLNNFKSHIDSDDDKDFIKTNLPLFAKRTQNQLYAYLNVLLFNTCKKKVFDDYEIKICDIYKHYWYITLYCAYLSRPIKTTEKQFVFIDEAQDLSVSEIELINKVNSFTNTPTVNLFGDINQMITNHGVKDWSSLEFVPEVYALDENFRNTNQIVEYCNRNLKMQMVKIGVDMDAVSEYRTIDDAIRGNRNIFNNAVFIVKDDYCVSDLKNLLDKTKIANYEIYTVKSAKGLEFKEIFVFDVDMSANEKYIAYTRALAKLTVIKDLPQTTDRNSSLVIQGNEQEDTSNANEIQNPM